MSVTNKSEITLADHKEFDMSKYQVDGLPDSNGWSRRNARLFTKDGVKSGIRRWATLMGDSNFRLTLRLIAGATVGGIWLGWLLFMALAGDRALPVASACALATLVLSLANVFRHRTSIRQGRGDIPWLTLLLGPFVLCMCLSSVVYGLLIAVGLL